MIGDAGEALKRVDPYLSRPASLIGAALRPWRRRRQDRILAVRPGGMGDLVMAQLAAEQLGLGVNDVDWLVESRSASWARHAGLRHFCYDRAPLTAIRAVAGRYSTVVNLEQRFGLSTAAARLATARGGRLTVFDTNRAAGRRDHQVAYDWDRSREVDEFGRLLAAAISVDWDPLPPPARRRTSDGTWVVSLGGTHSPSRNLGVQDWLRFIEQVTEDRPVVLTAGPLERRLANELVGASAGRARLFSGTFEEVIERIATAERLVAVDGGPVHIASYYGVPADVLFTSGRDQKWAPLAAGSVVHRRTDLACQPCTVFGQVPPCPIDFRCRKDIPAALQALPISGR